MALETGEIIDGKYRIVKLIGEGGMGAVYEGVNVRINRRVAIKVLHAAYTGNAEVMQRFEREAQAAGRIGNDHILEVLDLGQLGDGDHFIIMEFLDGEPLGARIKARERLQPAECAPLIRQVLEGLGAAHASGIIHRDLKPDNIFILREKAGVRDYVKIIDFGISKFNQLSGEGMKMTRTGAVMGTPYYMSPEQASGSAEADQRSDIYSMGVILYEAITGRVPFDADTFNQLLFKIVLSEVPPPETHVPDLNPAFSSIIAKAMARDVTQRFQTTTEFIQALDAWTASGAAVGMALTANAVPAGLLPLNPALGAQPGFRATAASSQVGLGQLPSGTNPGTGGNWATSQHDASKPSVPKKRAPIGALAAVAVLILGGAAYGAYSVLNGGSSADTTSPAVASTLVAEAKPPTPNPPTTPTSEPTPPAPAVVAAVEPHASSEPVAVSSPATSASVIPPPARHPAPVARPTPRAPATPVAAPAPAPTPATPRPGHPGGTDFGY